MSPPLLHRIASRGKRLLGSAVSFAINNVVVNNAAMALGCESSLKNRQHPYLKFRPSESRKPQENAGFSDRPEINEVVERMHTDLAGVAAGVAARESSRMLRALDIGCGPGLYLKDFSPANWDVTGLDMNPGMCELARQTCPHAQIVQGMFLSQSFPQPFDVIYSISVLMYFPKSDLDHFFQMIAESLVPGGMVFINYPHAVSKWDLWYPDLTYIQFSPRLIQSIAARHLTIVEHRHSLDPRSIDLFDEQPYASQSSVTNKSFRNSSVLIAQRAPA